MDASFNTIIILFRFPRYTYNSKTAILKVEYMPLGSLHESVVIACSEKAVAFKLAIPDNYQSRISIHLSTTLNGFDGAYRGSSKVPDLAVVEHDDHNEEIPRIFFEIGVSDSYDDLKQSARLWLEGMLGVRECVLIKIQESPLYHSPLIDNIEFLALN